MELQRRTQLSNFSVMCPTNEQSEHCAQKPLGIHFLHDYVIILIETQTSSFSFVYIWGFVFFFQSFKLILSFEYVKYSYDEKSKSYKSYTQRSLVFIPPHP